MNAGVLKVGIASREAIKARTLAVARGQHKPAPEEPKVWFTSMESLAQVLSTRNTLLLEMIAKTQPASVAELAELTGRNKGNLSRTLRTMRRYRLIEMKKGHGRRLMPRVPYDRIELDLALTAQQACCQGSTSAPKFDVGYRSTGVL
jgi:predicted transcriptional regulator